LVNCRTGNIKIDTTVADYTQLATFPSTEYVDNSFKNLINLKNDKDIATYKYENVAVTIPFSGLSSIPANLDENTVVNADFCTDGQLLSRGQIGAGTWTIDHVFVASGTCQIKVEAYLLNYNGQIVFNIFKSDYINPISISEFKSFTSLMMLRVSFLFLIITSIPKFSFSSFFNN
jgi:hypothetical protein